MAEKEKIFAPLTGKLLRLEDVPDPIFSKKVMGDGIAIQPTDGKVVSPVDGEVILVAETKHAIGIKSKTGAEILLHIGIDTVALKGEGFDIHVKAGEQVKHGDLLGTVDLDYIKQQASSTITPIIVTNGTDFEVFDASQESNTIAEETVIYSVGSAFESEPTTEVPTQPLVPNITKRRGRS